MTGSEEVFVKGYGLHSSVLRRGFLALINFSTMVSSMTSQLARLSQLKNDEVEQFSTLGPWVLGFLPGNHLQGINVLQTIHLL